MAPGRLATPDSFDEACTSITESHGLDFSKLQITKTTKPSKLPLAEDLAFGKHVTDHMLQVRWDCEYGWRAPQISPYADISLDPTACVFHYGFECFEGMKAYKDSNGEVRLFRPDKNLERFNRSAARIALPTFEAEELLKLIARFVRTEERFILGKAGFSLYLRPVMIGINRGLGVTAPTSALLYVIASPVGAYYSSGFKPIFLEATSSHIATRAWPGGAGNQKVGGNYAPTLAPERAAQKKGFQQILWLFGDNDCITEAGTMNLFILLRHGREQYEMITPPLDGTILPGVIRDCVLSLAKERLAPCGWLIHERKICMTELTRAADDGRLLEVFGTGTAAIVTPIRAIKYQDRLVHCGLDPNQIAGNVTGLMKEWIEARQYGTEEHDWSVVVDDVVR